MQKQITAIIERKNIIKCDTFYMIVVCLIISFIAHGCAEKTALIQASAKGDSQTVQTLIKEGANINQPDSNGVTPLMYAIWHSKIDTAKYLINSGADIKAKDKKGYDALLYAVEFGQLEIVQLLIEKGADIESKDPLGCTPLVFATKWDFANAADVVKLLIRHGADIKAKSPEGETVLDFALASARGDIVDDLIKSRRVNLWIPEDGKARVIFFCKDLYDYLHVTVGNRSKKLNYNTKAGVAFFDVDPGAYLIDANHEKYISKNRPTIEVIKGSTYYFQVTQNMTNRIVGYVAVVPSTLVDKISSSKPFPITTFKKR